MDLVVIAGTAASFNIWMGNVDNRARNIAAATKKRMGRAPVLEFDVTRIALLSGEIPSLWTRTFSIDPGDPLELAVTAMFYDLLAEADADGLSGGDRADECSEADEFDMVLHLGDVGFD